MAGPDHSCDRHIFIFPGEWKVPAAGFPLLMDHREKPARPEAIGPAAAVHAMLTRRRGVLGAAALAVAALAAGCGGSPQPETASRSAPSADGGVPPATAGPAPSAEGGQPPAIADPAAPRVTNGALPSIVVNDVAAGTKVDLSTVPPADKPLLVWFWAPH